MGKPKALTACLVLALGCAEQGEIVAHERTSVGGGTGLGGMGIDDPESGGSSSDGGTSSGGQSGDPDAPHFASPVSVEELNDPEAKDQDPTLTGDHLEIFFFSDRAGNADIWRSTRDDLNAPWGPPISVDELNSIEVEQNPAISRDGLRIWFYSRRDPLGIYYAERSTRDDSFGMPEPVVIVAAGSAGFPIAPSVDVSELRMAVSIGEADSRDLYELVRPSLSGSWGEAVTLSGVNSDNADSTPFLIDDGRELLFHSGRSGAGDLFWAYREAPGLAFTHVEPLTDVNDPVAFETHPHLTADGKWLYFGSTRSGNTDIYRAEVQGD